MIALTRPAQLLRFRAHPSPGLAPPRPFQLDWTHVALGAFLLAALAALTLRPDADRRLLSSLPQPERAALYQQTLAAVEGSCPPRAELTDRCAEEARFLARFPECDGACRETVARILPGPTR
jgi:cytochrome b pre-mRNA-processing protein 3